MVVVDGAYTVVIDPRGRSGVFVIFLRFWFAGRRKLQPAFTRKGVDYSAQILLFSRRETSATYDRRSALWGQHALLPTSFRREKSAAYDGRSALGANTPVTDRFSKRDECYDKRK